MKKMFEIIPESLTAAITKNKLVAVLVIEKKESVLPLIRTLYDAGLRVIELTLRTPVAIDAIKIIKKEFPDIILGAGTVLTVEQLAEVHSHQVDFAVAPGLNKNILEHALKLELPFFPGVMTPSEIELAISYGCRTLKFFPSESVGGLNYLKSANAPYAHLQMSYIPLGGVNISNLSTYVSNPIISAVGGSWLAPPKLVNEENWEQISQNVKDALKVINN